MKHMISKIHVLLFYISSVEAWQLIGTVRRHSKTSRHPSSRYCAIHPSQKYSPYPNSQQNRYKRRIFSSDANGEVGIDDESLDHGDEVIDYQQHELEFFDEAERDANRDAYPKGTPEGFYVTRTYQIPTEGFDISRNPEIITKELVNRLEISGGNITVSIALMLLDPETYPSVSRARKACRKGSIIVNRGPLLQKNESENEEFDQLTCFQGRVIDRVYPGDVIGIQKRMHGGFYPGFDTSRPPFELPVIYEDDHFAIINKPAGVVVYAQHMITIRSALPFYLKPPKRGTRGIIRRPELVHRLDKPTSGLLIVAKTRPAIVDLTRQFEERRVKKTYTAIVNGIPSEPFETEISVKDALSLGVNVDPNDHDSKWQLIDNSLDEKSAITVWKTLRYSKSLKAKDGILTLVEMKPKTGRYHQLRRHMAWVKGCSIVGDTTYDGGEEAAYLRGRGLFLCSNRVILEHPYYNTEKGRAEWMKLPELQKYANGKMKLSDDGSVVQVHASIDLPNKFQGFLLKEAEREEKFRQKEMPFRD